MSTVVRTIINLYQPRFLSVLVQEFKRQGYDTGSYVKWLLQTNDFQAGRNLRFGRKDKHLAVSLGAVYAVLLLIGGMFMLSEAKDNTAGGYFFGLSLIIAAPLLVGILVPLLYFAIEILHFVIRPKQIGKHVISSLLEAQAVRLREKYDFKVVAVGGSMGKTSTKLAIAELLKATGLKVRYQEGNFNDRLTVPLVLFNQPLPHLLNIAAWTRVLLANERTLRTKYQYDVAVLELGTDAPGQMARFSYLKPDIAVVTAVAAEHMEFFGSLEAVAKEELTMLEYSKKTLINTDDVAADYLKHPLYTGYGLLQKSDGYYAKGKKENLTGQDIEVHFKGKKILSQRTVFLGTQGKKIVLAAVAVADMLKVDHKSIAAAVKKLQPFAGRMQILKGLDSTILIDDTYNATPAAVEAALSVLQGAKATQRIAVLGSMNELGEFSIEAHKTIGASINPKKVELVITIGEEARDYLAPVAKENGCTVKSFLNPKLAGEYVSNSIREGAVILFKGSQNGVFAEEAIKPLLADSSDADKLVRQSRHWMRRKRKQFKLS